MSKKNATAVRGAIMTVVGIILCITLIPLLIVNITLIFCSAVYPNEVPGFLGFKPIIVLSDSMNPTIKTGSLALVRQTDAGLLKNNDIVAYKDSNVVIAHRITTIVESGGVRQFITKGDNSNVNDSVSLSGNRILGIYLFSIPNLGYFSLFMQTPLGMILFIVLPLIMLLLHDVVHHRSSENESKNTVKQYDALPNACKLIHTQGSKPAPGSEFFHDKNETSRN